MSEPTTGGNPAALAEAARQGAESLNHTAGEFAAQVKPLAAEAADRMAETFRKHASSDLFRDISTKGMMAGGAVAALDGVRRFAQKDENGKTHRIRGLAQTAVGIGAFTAAVITRRQNGNDGQSL